MAKDNPFNLFNNDSSNSSSFASREQNTNDINQLLQDIRTARQYIIQFSNEIKKYSQLIVKADNKIAQVQADTKTAQTELGNARTQLNQYLTQRGRKSPSKIAQYQQEVQKWQNNLNKLNTKERRFTDVKVGAESYKNQYIQGRQIFRDQQKFHRQTLSGLRSQREQSLIDDINAQFKDSKLSKAFYNKFVRPDKLGLTKTGQVVGAGMAAALQEQDRFIRKLVLSLGQLPFFRTVGKGLQQFGGIMALHGASQFIGKDSTVKDRLGGLVEVIGGGLIALMPVLATLFGQVLGTMLGNLLGRKLLAKAFFDWIKGSKGAGAVAQGAGAAAQGATQSGKAAAFFSKLSGIKTFFGNIGSKLTPFFSKLSGIKTFFGNLNSLFSKLGVLGKFAGVFSVITGLLDVGQGLGKIFSGDKDKKREGWADLLTGIGAILLPFFPLVGIITMIAGSIIKFFPNIMKWLKQRWPFGKDKGEGGGGGGAEWIDSSTSPTTYNNVSTSNIDKSIQWKDTGKPTSTWSNNGWDYYRYGGRPENMGQGYWLSQGFNSKAYSKDDLNRFAREGKFNLESLQGGNGVKIANTFYNDAMAGRKGSNILLQLAASRMKQMGHGDLILTSALASATSGHAGGKFGHSGGQTFDFSAAGMSKEQAVQYAKDLYSTGLFSHAQAEYDKKKGEWHIDARLSDQAYNTLNKVAENVNEDKRPVNKMATEQVKEPPGQMAFDKTVDQNLGLSLSSGLFHRMSIGG